MGLEPTTVALRVRCTTFVLPVYSGLGEPRNLVAPSFQARWPMATHLAPPTGFEPAYLLIRNQTLIQLSYVGKILNQVFLSQASKYMHSHSSQARPIFGPLCW